jgi:tetratricopeptide (TPR) repeat protein
LLIYNLGTSRELSVQNSQTMSEVYRSMGQTQIASMVPTVSREAAMKLKAGTYITGNYQKTGNKIRIIVKLFDTKTDELLWTGKVDGNINADYIDLADSLSIEVKNFLEIKALGKNASLDFREAYTGSSEAYRKYIEGMNYFMNSNYMSAIQSLKEAFKIDSTFTLAAFYIAYSYNNFTWFNGSALNLRYCKEWTQKAYEGIKRLPADYQIWVSAWKATYNKSDPNEMLNLYSSLENSDIKSRYYWYDIGSTYCSYGKNEKAVSAFKKIEDISSEWGGNWKYMEYYAWYGTACHNTGDHKKESKIYETGLSIFPDNDWLIYNQAKCAISLGDTAKSSELVNKLVAVCKEKGYPAEGLESGLGDLYLEAKSLIKSEEHYRRALELKPESPDVMRSLAYLLINYNNKVDEGMKLINRALELSPGNPIYLRTLGLGYYKQGKYEEALSKYKVAWDSSLTINPDLDKKIQDVKDALASQKNN